MNSEASEIKEILGESKVYTTFNGTEVTIRPFPLRKYLGIYSDFINLVNSLTTKYPDLDFEKMKPEDFLMLGEMLPQITAVIEKMLDFEPDTLLDNMDVNDFLEIVRLVLVVNSYEKIVKNFQLAKGMVQAKQG